MEILKGLLKGWWEIGIVLSFDRGEIYFLIVFSILGTYLYAGLRYSLLLEMGEFFSLLRDRYISSFTRFIFNYGCNYLGSTAL